MTLIIASANVWKANCVTDRHTELWRALHDLDMSKIFINKRYTHKYCDTNHTTGYQFYIEMTKEALAALRHKNLLPLSGPEVLWLYSAGMAKPGSWCKILCQSVDKLTAEGYVNEKEETNEY